MLTSIVFLFLLKSSSRLERSVTERSAWIDLASLSTTWFSTTLHYARNDGDLEELHKLVCENFLFFLS
jgi:hypothetical protein